MVQLKIDELDLFVSEKTAARRRPGARRGLEARWMNGLSSGQSDKEMALSRTRCTCRPNNAQ
jgi:hypothetical protein